MVNLKEQILSVIARNDWDLDTMITYIYIETCKFFTYDFRYFVMDNDDFRLALRMKKFNLENIYDNRVICASYAREIIAELLKEIGIDVQVIGGEHQYVAYIKDNKKLKIDPFGVEDFTRIKMGMEYFGLKTLTKDNDRRYKKALAKSCGYIKNDYYPLEDKLTERFEYYQSLHINILEKLDCKFKELAVLLNDFSVNDAYCDSNACLRIMKKFLLTSEELYRVKSTIFFNPLEKDFDFTKVIMLPESNYVLRREKKLYSLKPISMEDVNAIASSYEMY